jgi:hypothetical protein
MILRNWYLDFKSKIISYYLIVSKKQNEKNRMKTKASHFPMKK